MPPTPPSPYQPPTPEFWACIRLALAELPPPRLRTLLAAAASPVEVLEMPGSVLCAPPHGLTAKQQERLSKARDLVLPPKMVEQAHALGVSVVPFGDADFPANLLPFSDAPALLFVRGRLLPDDKFSVALVGSRRATHYGHKQAERFARAFAERGLVVVSGGAAGVDTAAHKGALWAGGRTIAVVASGLDIAYPSENRRLFEEIVEKGGAVVSEFALGTTPEPWRFPARNRIIAGMTRCTVLVETPGASGALITARDAAQYGRDVWVVPGPVDTGRSRGGHQLIQDGASLADGPDDVLASLGLPVGDEYAPAAAPPPVAEPEKASGVAAPEPPPAAVTAGLTPDEARLLQHIDLTPRHLDEAAGSAGLAASQATVAATLLEMKGLIRRLPGSLYARAL